MYDMSIYIYFIYGSAAAPNWEKYSVHQQVNYYIQSARNVFVNWDYWIGLKGPVLVTTNKETLWVLQTSLLQYLLDNFCSWMLRVDLHANVPETANQMCLENKQSLWFKYLWVLVED